MTQPQTIVAEQTSRNWYWQPAPLPPREVEMTIHLRIPEGEDSDVGISLEFVPRLAAIWEDELHQRIYDGVHSGLANVGASLPVGGIGIRITELRLSPPLDQTSHAEDVRHVGDILEAQTAATVAVLWTGLISLGASAA